MSIDPDHQLLSSFASAEVTVMGEIIGHFPGDIHVCGVRLDNAIIVRICLSSQCAVEGVIKGLSDEDYSQCKRKVISGKDIKGFLANGVEPQNANAVTFTPTILFVNALVDKLRSAIRYYSPLSLYEVENHLIRHVWNANTTERKASPSDMCDLSTPVALSSSDDLRLFTLAALGFTYSQMEMLAKNHMLKRENRHRQNLRFCS